MSSLLRFPPVHSNSSFTKAFPLQFVSYGNAQQFKINKSVLGPVKNLTSFKKTSQKSLCKPVSLCRTYFWSLLCEQFWRDKVGLGVGCFHVMYLSTSLQEFIQFFLLYSEKEGKEKCLICREMQEYHLNWLDSGLVNEGFVQFVLLCAYILGLSV